MVTKESAVHNPLNEVEKAVQECYHDANPTAGWLSMHDCRLFADAIYSLKRYSKEWFENKSILKSRISFFFAPEMKNESSEIVFLTFPLFLRETLERKVIDDYLASPVTFVTKAIAHYLFPEYPVQIYLNKNKLEEYNDSIFNKIGNLWIADSNVTINNECIVQGKSSKHAFNVVQHIVIPKGIQKAAVTEISRNIFKIDPDEKYLSTGSNVLHKRTNQNGTIMQIEPGESGYVHIKMNNGNMMAVDKINFDLHFIVTNIKVASLQIENIIKEKIKQDRLIQYIFDQHDININEVDGLKILIVPLEDKYAETDAERMSINVKLFDNGIEYFMQKYFYIICHELIHFITRKKEEQHYLNDPEEVLGFCVAIAYQLEHGVDEQQIREDIYDKISWHFKDKSEAEEFFNKEFIRAREILSAIH